MKLDLIYYLLLSNYANSTILGDDINRFKYKVFSIIFQYGPTWAKELEIQKKIRNLTDAELATGNTVITNMAENPSTTPSTSTLDELNYVNNQNVNKNKLSKVNALAMQAALLKDDVTEKFINKFQPLFTKFVKPTKVPVFITYPDDPNYNDEYLYSNKKGYIPGFRTMYFSQIFPTYEDFKAEWDNTPFAEEV